MTGTTITHGTPTHTHHTHTQTHTHTHTHTHTQRSRQLSTTKTTLFYHTAQALEKEIQRQFYHTSNLHECTGVNGEVL